MNHLRKRKKAKFKRTGECIYRNELAEACFQYEIALRFKDSPRITVSDKL